MRHRPLVHHHHHHKVHQCHCTDAYLVHRWTIELCMIRDNPLPDLSMLRTVNTLSNQAIPHQVLARSWKAWHATATIAPRCNLVRNGIASGKSGIARISSAAPPTNNALVWMIHT